MSALTRTAAALLALGAGVAPGLLGAADSGYGGASATNCALCHGETATSPRHVVAWNHAALTAALDDDAAVSVHGAYEFGQTDDAYKVDCAVCHKD